MRLLSTFILIVCGPRIALGQTILEKEIAVKRKEFNGLLNKSGRLFLEHLVNQAHKSAKARLSAPKTLDPRLKSKLSADSLPPALVGGEAFDGIAVRKESLSLVFSKGEETARVSFSRLFEGKLSINGNVLDLDVMKSESGLSKFLNLYFTEEKVSVSASALSLIMPNARAGLGLAVAGAALVVVIDFLYGWFDSTTRTPELLKRFKELEDKMKKVVERCESDLQAAKAAGQRDEVINQTTEFIHALKERSYQDEEELLSCEHLKEDDAVLSKSKIFGFEFFSRVKEMCGLGSNLDACLQETQMEIDRKKIYTLESSQDKKEFMEGSPYKDMLGSIGSEAKGN